MRGPCCGCCAHTPVDGEAGGRAAGEENAWKFRPVQHVLRVVLQLLPRKAGLPAGGLSRPVPSSRVHVFLGEPMVGRGGQLAQRVLVYNSGSVWCWCQIVTVTWRRTAGSGRTLSGEFGFGSDRVRPFWVTVTFWGVFLRCTACCLEGKSSNLVSPVVFVS